MPILKSTKKSQDLSQLNKTNEQEQQTTSQVNFPEEFDLSKPSFNDVYDKLKNSDF